MGRGCPITPVDMTRVLDGELETGEEEMLESTVLAMEMASLRPCLPVTALAQPELMTIARRPSPFRTCRVSRLMVTGAAWNLFFVKTAAAEHGRSEAIRARSGSRVLEALTPT